MHRTLLLRKGSRRLGVLALMWLLSGFAPLAAEDAAALQFSGQKSFTDVQLRGAITEQVREINERGLTPARADDAAFYVGTFYRKAGFSKVEVEYEIHGKQLLLKIREGTQSVLRRVIFVGNRSIPEATLYQYMIGATPDRLAREPAQFPYTSAEISAGGDRVRGLYLSEGYLNVSVDTSGLQLSADERSADVTVRIVEGTRFTFGAIRFQGRPIYADEELRHALGTASGAPFSPGTANAMQRNLESYLKAHGYYQAEVKVDADPTKASGGTVPTTFTITPGPIFYFDGAVAKNETPNPRLRADFLPKRFAHLKGRVYDPEKLDETFREMLRTGLFESLRVTPKVVDEDHIQLELTAKEAKARELGFTIGFGSYEGGTVGFRSGDRDLFGLGRPLTFAADYTQRGLRGELLYVDPWLFDGPYALRARLYSESRDELGYSKKEYGVRTDLTRRVLPHLELGVFAEGQSVSVETLGIDPLFLGPESYTLLSVGVTQNSDFRKNSDSRNDAINPSSGFVLSSSLDFATLDGEPAFTRVTARASFFLPLGKTLLVFGGRVGYIAPIIDQIPIDSRFFTGGSTSVRSFAERELGPKDHGGNPLGGELMTVMNVEYIFPLAGALQGAVFVDAGSLKNEEIKDDPSGRARDASGLCYAIGAGLRYKLPIGPLRLDYGVNPSPSGDEAFGAFHFSFGFAF